MNLMRYMWVTVGCIGLAGCYAPPPPKPHPQPAKTKVVCTRNWHGDVVCTRRSYY